MVHPPLLGPAVLGPLATELRSRGYVVVLPDLRDAVEHAAGWPDRAVAACRALGPADAVLGFSGAGPLLPAVAVATGARRVVLVDAVLPARHGATVPGDRIRAFVLSRRREDRIAPWPQWWPPGTVEGELPDAAVREAVCAEARSLPADFYDVAVPVPERWPSRAVRYVQLSPGYQESADDARARGWEVTGDGAGVHLDVAGRAARVADLVLGPTPAPR